MFEQKKIPQNEKLAIIGAGNIGIALIQGILKMQLTEPINMIVTNKSKHNVLENLQKTYGIKITNDNKKAVYFADIIFLAVKPQDMLIAIDQIKQALSPDKLIVSTAAGVSINSIKKMLEISTHPIVRIMPNTPTQIGEGVSGWSASEEVNDRHKQIIGEILSSLGIEVYFENEEYLNHVTAVSGSGPAYIFYLAEILIKAGEEIGLTTEDAQKLTIQTIFGAATMLRSNGLTPADLRCAVTSKGGTTEAALSRFTAGRLDNIIGEGVKAAFEKGLEIGTQW